jgi:c-di-GMP-binding flagellar brake protein YcgR
MESENRREYFRHTFRPTDRLRVELRPFAAGRDRPPLVGKAVNLSLGRIAVLLADEIVPSERDELWVARFVLPGEADGPSGLALKCTVVHGHPDESGYVYGFQFRGIDTPSHANDRRVLWRFLLNEEQSNMEVRPTLDTPEDGIPLGIELCVTSSSSPPDAD